MKTNPILHGIRNNNNHRGFTLVELLVCITIIAVLAGLVFVVTGKVRSQAQQSNAVSALRQVGLANIAYYSDNNGAINVIRDSTEKGLYEGGGKWVSSSFMGRMQPYLFAGLDTTDQKRLADEITASLSQLLGASDLKNMTGTLFSGVSLTTDGSAIRNPFAINDKLRPVWGGKNPPLRVNNFGDPSDILYMTYGRYYFNYELGKTYRPLPIAGDNSRTIYYTPSRKGIFCFLDGHIELLSPPIAEHLFGESPTKL